MLHLTVAGDRLLAAGGEWLTIDAVEETADDEVVSNCRVAGYHTDGVGDEGWGWAVWANHAYWDHGTDSLSAASIVATGPNAAALPAVSDIDRLPGLYVTLRSSEAGDYARLRTLDRNNEQAENGLGATLIPVIIMVDDAVICPYLRPRRGAIAGEMYIPQALFPQVPPGAFHFSGIAP
ncbi:hypothetical protein [Tuwongella immobilis]|uniref:hypothetical protein n=1 Tax=Tuwongella immobilis TaxID=692036 RepID=UPI0013A6C41F|nr:hypothetical protein [Tuwongella immobilis]